MSMKSDIQSGVWTHSTDKFWRTFDLWKLKPNALMGVSLACDLRSRFGFKRMVYRISANSWLTGPHTTVASVLMIPTDYRAEVWAYFEGHSDTRNVQDWLIEDSFWHLGMPLNLGGGKFTRQLFAGDWDWDKDKPLEEVGYVEQVHADHSWERDFIFNDYSQKLFWSVVKDKPVAPATRSLGKTYAPSTGHRYGSNVHA